MNYNRIVIVGNGFDLAMGLETSYKDFFIDYYRNCLIAGAHGPYEDKLISVISSNAYLPLALEKAFNEATSIDELNKLVKRFKFKVNIIHNFFEIIWDGIEDKSWIDIEKIFYSELIKLKHLENPTRAEELEKLNGAMEFLSEKLKEYIHKVQKPTEEINKDSTIMELVNTCFMPLGVKEKSIVHGYDPPTSPDAVLFLNFNYTNTLENFIKISRGAGISKHISIHGSVNNENNPIIFGYGDDTTTQYNELEDEDEDGFLKNIKSFKYPQTRNYHNLLNFIEDEKYEIFVIGHSCGLSDKTLLKTLFEHDSCLAVKVFYHVNQGDHFNKRIAMSRHFSNKVKMRKIILPFDEKAIVPQEKAT